ncbi:MAG: Gfo/Idh/MocA family oxidoreductase [Saprospiraceae bacterium]|nr:Gfo/Idh/MocA family oxidoreductase [Saprospiraceae bacterium]
MNRRHFIKNSSLAGLALTAHPFIVRKRVSKYSVALIGSGWWGTNILREAIRSGEVQVVALCDVDLEQIKKCDAEVQRLCTDRPKHFTDYRECIKATRPDIVINATPDHWHALIAIEAMQGGAHLFLEKPIGHTVKEGTAIQRVARDTQRICIVDFHRRYSPHNVSGMDFLRSGRVGKVSEVRAFVNYGWGANVQPDPVEPVPADLDWDFYCGPSEKIHYSKNIHPRGWRQYGAFANGLIGDWAPHWFDQILWWTEERAPRRIFSTARYPNVAGARDMPQSQLAVYEFEGFTATWEHSLLNHRPDQPGENVGVKFLGTEGTFHMGWQQGWTFYPADSNKDIITQGAKLDEPDSQNIKLVWADFLASIKSGKLPHADIEHGRQATNMSLLGMLSARLGRSLVWDEKNDMVVGDEEANGMLRREYRGEWEYPR